MQNEPEQVDLFAGMGTKWTNADDHHYWNPDITQ
jgi:hypothetical protein